MQATKNCVIPPPPPAPPLETRRELEPKCVAQSFLGSLPVTCRSAIGQFVSLSLVSYSAQFPPF